MTVSGPSPVHALVQRLASNETDVVLGAGPLEDGWALTESLWGPDRIAIDRLLAYQRAFSEDLDRKGQAAYLVTQYAAALALPVSAGLVAGGAVPDIGADRLAFRLERRTIAFEGRSVAGERLHLRFTSARFATDDPSLSAHPDADAVPDRAALTEHVRLAFERHFAPLLDWLHADSRLSRNAMWRLVGDAIGAAFLAAGRKTGRLADARRDALAILKHRGSPLTNKEMRFVDLVLVDPAAPEREVAAQCFRARGGCCRYYTVKGGLLCTTCVLQDPSERDRRVLAGMRARFGPRGETLVLRSEA